MTPSRVYADHAATTPLSRAAFEAMLPFLRDEFGNPSSIHSWARVPRQAVVEAREAIAKCINAEVDEIFFTSGGTESDNWVVKGSTGGRRSTRRARLRNRRSASRSAPRTPSPTSMLFSPRSSSR
jgi:cysteine sulfinate desulfinase/cysteine desulfurase-like protein